eukprot:812968-Karenia_brevis.AAC.1
MNLGFAFRTAGCLCSGSGFSSSSDSSPKPPSSQQSSSAVQDGSVQPWHDPAKAAEYAIRDFPSLSTSTPAPAL